MNFSELEGENRGDQRRGESIEETRRKEKSRDEKRRWGHEKGERRAEGRGEETRRGHEETADGQVRADRRRDETMR